MKNVEKQLRLYYQGVELYDELDKAIEAKGNDSNEAEWVRERLDDLYVQVGPTVREQLQEYAAARAKT